MKKIFYLVIMLGVIIVDSISLAVPPKCSPCQAAKSIRDAAAQSMAEAVVLALSVAKQFSAENELDNGIYCEKCGCGRTTRDELSGSITAEKCGCSRTTRDALVFDVYCEKCGCGKIRRDVLETTSLTEAAVADLDAGVVEIGAGVSDVAIGTSDVAIGTSDVASLLGNIGSTLNIRAPREALADPCNTCGSVSNPVNACQINGQVNAQLLALRNCCACVGQLVQAQGNDARRCCKKLRHKIDKVEDLVEEVVIQISASDSVTDTILGDFGSTAVVIDPCAGGFAAAVNATNADVIAWLKGLYILIGSLVTCG